MKSRKVCTPTADELQALYEAPRAVQAQPRVPISARGPITQVELWLFEALSWTECDTPGYQYEKMRRILVALRRSGPKTELEAKLIPAVTDILFKEQTQEEYNRCRKVVDEAEDSILGMAAAGVPIEAGEVVIARSKAKGEEDCLAILDGPILDEEEWEALPAVAKSQRLAKPSGRLQNLNRCFNDAALALDIVYEAAVAGDASAEKCLRSLASKAVREGGRFGF